MRIWLMSASVFLWYYSRTNNFTARIIGKSKKLSLSTYFGDSASVNAFREAYPMARHHAMPSAITHPIVSPKNHLHHLTCPSLPMTDILALPTEIL
jgi:hypothetical protein